MGKVLKDDLIIVKESKLIDGEKKILINAKATLDDIYNSSNTPELLKNILEKWLTWQERDEIDIASSISSLGLAPQWYAALLAWDALIIKIDGSEVDMNKFLSSRGRKSEIDNICITAEVQNRISAESAICRTPRDVPIVFAAAVIDFEKDIIKDARLAMTGVWQKSVQEVEAVKILIGEKLTCESITKVNDRISNEVDPKADFRGSVEYRREMASILTKRVLEMCMKGVN